MSLISCNAERYRRLGLSCSLILGALACTGTKDAPGSPLHVPESISENAEIQLPAAEAEADAVARAAESRTAKYAWAGMNHVNLSMLAAWKWGLPPSRTNVIGGAADDPDTYESGLESAFNQQWSHAYLYSPFGFWVWGDANETFDDCITGRLAGQAEGPECKDGASAAYYYAAGNQMMGDTYLGYATHYIEDVGQVLHGSDPTLALDMLTEHFAFEDWVNNNWTAGHDFQATVAADYYYYPITDLQRAVRNAAWGASYWNPSSPGRKAWSAFRRSGYPTGAGTGDFELVSSTKQMLIRASRYAVGAIKYTLDTYSQWNAAY